MHTEIVGKSDEPFLHDVGHIILFYTLILGILITCSLPESRKRYQHPTFLG